MNFDTVIVAGSYDGFGGRSSGYARHLFDKFAGFGDHFLFFNGGSLHLLKEAYREALSADVVFWFADVPNTEPKLIQNLKADNPKCILISSKNNTGGRYKFLELVHRALITKSNLCLEFRKNPDGRVSAVVFDPLGNQFNQFPFDIRDVRESLERRVLELLNFTRSSSISVSVDLPDAIVDESDFFEVVRGHAENLHLYSHSDIVSTPRFVGNLSFRCESGFPSYRHGSYIFVSRRNIDKRGISFDGMVPVIPDGIDPVQFLGVRKPSVDAPVQVLLYQQYKRARYMFHAHAYIPDAPFTKAIVPCGAIEEVPHILAVAPASSVNFCVNLKGHGCLAVADNVDFMRRLTFKPRILPEMCETEE